MKRGGDRTVKWSHSATLCKIQVVLNMACIKKAVFHFNFILYTITDCGRKARDLRTQKTDSPTTYFWVFSPSFLQNPTPTGSMSKLQEWLSFPCSSGDLLRKLCSADMLREKRQEAAQMTSNNADRVRVWLILRLQLVMYPASETKSTDSKEVYSNICLSD